MLAAQRQQCHDSVAAYLTSMKVPVPWQTLLASSSMYVRCWTVVTLRTLLFVGGTIAPPRSCLTSGFQALFLVLQVDTCATATQADMATSRIDITDAARRTLYPKECKDQVPNCSDRTRSLDVA
jgi:hypothetical protein